MSELLTQWALVGVGNLSLDPSNCEYTNLLWAPVKLLCTQF